MGRDKLLGRCVCVCICRGRREWRGAKWVWVKVLGIYDETTEAIARETLSRCVARVKMSQSEFAILPEASGKCERGVSYRWQSRICFGGATAGALWDGHIEAHGNQPMAFALFSTSCPRRSTLLPT
jgi:hypothetical protein